MRRFLFRRNNSTQKIVKSGASVAEDVGAGAHALPLKSSLKKSHIEDDDEETYCMSTPSETTVSYLSETLHSTMEVATNTTITTSTTSIIKETKSVHFAPDEQQNQTIAIAANTDCAPACWYNIQELLSFKKTTLKQAKSAVQSYTANNLAYRRALKQVYFACQQQQQEAGAASTTSTSQQENEMRLLPPTHCQQQHDPAIKVMSILEQEQLLQQEHQHDHMEIDDNYSIASQTTATTSATTTTTTSFNPIHTLRSANHFGLERLVLCHMTDTAAVSQQRKRFVAAALKLQDRLRKDVPIPAMRAPLLGETLQALGASQTNWARMLGEVQQPKWVARAAAAARATATGTASASAGEYNVKYFM